MNGVTTALLSPASTLRNSNGSADAANFYKDEKTLCSLTVLSLRKKGKRLFVWEGSLQKNIGDIHKV